MFIFIGKMDHTCFTFNGNGYAAGGWNVHSIGALPNMSERYDHTTKEWLALDLSQSKMPDMLRSSGYTVLNNNPALVGGVSCMVNTGGSTSCTKEKTVYRFNATADGYIWENSQGITDSP